MFLHKGFDGLLDRVMIASLDLLLTELGKPALDLIDPRTVGWGKVQVVARPFGQPATHERGLVGGVVIQDDMNLSVFRPNGIDLVQKSRNSTERCRRQHLVSTLPVATSRAAKSEVVPWRM